MLNKLISIYDYLFRKPDVEEVTKLKNILTPKEYMIFLDMDDYDQVHSLKVYDKVCKDKILKEKKIYLKLALLHDCGKKNASLFRRIKTHIKKDEVLENHPTLGYEKIKELNLNLAKLISQHHEKNLDGNMKRFQKIDDIS